MKSARVLMLGVAVTGLAGLAFAAPTKLSNVGDSISQGFGANGWPGDHPDLSFVRGTDSGVNSVFSRYQASDPAIGQEPESVSGAEMVGGGDSFAAQASRICSQGVKPDHVTVMLGGNDVCNRDRSDTDDATANMYSIDTWLNGLRAGLDQLATCLPAGATVHVLSVPRVDFLYEAGHDKGFWCTDVIWPVAGICRIVTAEDDAGRRQQIGARVNEYNVATTAELAVYDGNQNGKNPNGLRFVGDWEGSIEEGGENTSVGAYAFGDGDINDVDCFHPNTSAQGKLACTAWSSNPDGSGEPTACLE
jgi:lysophospholipase L1-like esterase